MSNANYVDVIYNPSSKPFTDYPSKLINYLIKRYKLAKNSSLLELGCGRGNASDDAQDLRIHLARIRLPTDRDRCREAHARRHQAIELTDLRVIAVKQG